MNTSTYYCPCPPPECPPSITTDACAHVPNNETPVAVIIRFPLWRVEECRSALMKNLTVHKGYTGRVAGVGRNIQCIEGGWPCNKGVAMLCFDSCEEAIRWTVSNFKLLKLLRKLQICHFLPQCSYWCNLQYFDIT